MFNGEIEVVMRYLVYYFFYLFHGPPISNDCRGLLLLQADITDCKGLQVRLQGLKKHCKWIHWIARLHVLVISY